MRHFIAAVVGATALSITCSPGASAADMPTKAPITAPGYNWTGLYVGIQGAAAWGRISGVQDFAGDVSGPFKGTGGLFGGTVGYNWQWSNWITGVEADFAWAHLTASGNDAAVFPECTAGGLGTCGGTLQSFGTARGRLGYSLGPAMVYGTIGLGFGRIHDFVSNPTPGTGGATEWNSGLVFGGGVETMLWQNWSAKFEYLHANLGDGPIASYFPSPFASIRTNDWRMDVVRAGLNYQFDWHGR